MDIEEIKQIAYDFTTSKGDCKKLENRILSLFGVVGQSEQLADHKCKPMVNADWSYLKCGCGKIIKPKG